MLRQLQLRQGVLAFVLVGIGVAAHAQIIGTPEPTLPPGYCTGGPFTLTAGAVQFHLALDDRPLAPPMEVTMRFYDSAGNIVARRTATLAAGQTTTLEFRGTGLLRAQATFGSLLNPSDRRETAASVELFDGDNFRAEIPVKCVPNENIGR
jgi:hypothetical protein